jgi:hypothetical protein
MEFSHKKNTPFYYNSFYDNFQNNNIYRGNHFRGGRNRGRASYNKGHRNESNYLVKNNYYINPAYKQQFHNSYNRGKSLDRIKNYISMTYPYLININSKNSNILKEINTDCKFFIIKSFDEEDIHKSIKYGIWSSSKNGNKVLSEAFNITKERSSFVYLFFSCNQSGRYAGVAKMKSECNFNRIFDLWATDNKWQGLFDVEWIFIKDVPLKEFKDIIIKMKNGVVEPITRARDTQEIPFEQAKTMLKINEKYEYNNSILENFEYYDMRQNNYEKNKNIQKNQEIP